MSIHVDPNTKTITIPQGDTGTFTVSLSDGEGNAPSPAISGTGKFAICRKTTTKYTTLAYKDITVVDNTVTVALTNADTENVDPGEYFWDIRVLSAPETDATDGAVETDQVGEVHSLYALRDSGMPKFIVKGVAVDV